MSCESGGNFACRWWCASVNRIESLEWRRIRVRGADRLSYLQGQLTQDISIGLSHRSLVLQPSGEVLSDLEVFVGDDFIDLVAPESLADEVSTRLERFVLRVDVQFEAVGAVDIEGRLSALVERAWPSAFEWAHALPPHSFGQHVVDQTVSFTKGCFTGQEMVGRADARGATMPWRFIAGRGGDSDSISTLLKNSGPVGPQGVSSQYTHEDVEYWQGVAHRSFDTSALARLGAELTYFA